MAKWYSVATGLEVPATEVRELIPGSGLFLHTPSITSTYIIERTGNVVISDPIERPTAIGYAVKLGDTEKFVPSFDYVRAQVLASQTALLAKG